MLFQFSLLCARRAAAGSVKGKGRGEWGRAKGKKKKKKTTVIPVYPFWLRVASADLYSSREMVFNGDSSGFDSMGRQTTIAPASPTPRGD